MTLRTRRTRVYLLAAVAAVLLLPASSHGQTVRTLTGSVGPGHSISLRNAKGAMVRTLQPGKYRIVVRDRAAIHNFHLFGAGVNKSTGVVFTGKVTWTVTFKGGKVYTYRCDPHRSTLTRKVTVAGGGTSPAPPPPPTTPPPPPPPDPYP